MARLWGRKLAGVLACLMALAPLVSCGEVWLYTLVSADYDGVSLMPHFLEHYYKLRVGYHRMLVNVHHNPAKYDRAALDMILGICASYRVYCRVWEGLFSSEDHYNRTLALLDQFVPDPDDWVVIADSDELQDYGGSTIPDFLARAEGAGASYVTGDLVDRLAPGGRLRPIAPAPALPRQFPLQCRVVKALYQGWDFKVTAFKAYLRAGRANHIIVRPDKARAYFGPCAPGAKCPRGRNINLEADWFQRTPYAKYPAKYRYKDSPKDAAGLWDAVEHRQRITINHYKWHAGVLPNMRDRAEYYSGDCVLGVNEDSCTPRLLHWRESAKTYAAIKDTLSLDLTGMRCQPSPDAAAAAQTTRAGAGAGGGQVSLGAGGLDAGLWQRDGGSGGDAAGAVGGEEPFEEPAAGEEEPQGPEEGGEGGLPEGGEEAGAEAAAAAAAAAVARGARGSDAGGEEDEGEAEEEEGPEEVQELAAKSAEQQQAEQQQQQRLSEEGRAAVSSQGGGSLESAVEATAGAVEAAGGRGRGQGQAWREQGGQRGAEDGNEAQLAQAEIQAAVHGAVQSLLHGEEQEGGAKKALVEGDYQGEAGEDEGPAGVAEAAAADA